MICTSSKSFQSSSSTGSEFMHSSHVDKFTIMYLAVKCSISVSRPCSGDSGSGLVWTKGYEKILVAVVVAASACYTNEPVTYVPVACQFTLIWLLCFKYLNEFSAF